MEKGKEKMTEENSRHNHVMEDKDDPFMDSLVKRLQAAAIKQPRRHPHIIYRIAPFGLFSIANCLRNIENVSNCIAKILARIMLCGNLH
ncbi:hypothetical protein MRB53_027934 [Persea americana]|uniref:Uncharacterized protein n=1 Tax=Persea americana TaxID=3435 RepID=A0ACC2KEL4_PERAE|nr:hypothetical protein MRB53_027934 [Persea americana]